MKQDSLGDRMKNNYENRYRLQLTRRTPVIMRLDGKAFHTLTAGAEKPYDITLINTMNATAAKLMSHIQGAKCAYVQSDEISILITDFDKITTDAWFDYNVQKMVSVSAAVAAVEFSAIFGKSAYFDSRVFNIPKDEVINYFRWRYQDWIRNSIQMLAQSLYSHKELHGKKSPELHEMCFQKGKNWAGMPSRVKNGTFHFLHDEEKITSKFNLMDNNDMSNVYIDNVLNPVLFSEE